MAAGLDLHLELRSVGGYTPLASLDGVFDGWKATDPLNGIGLFQARFLDSPARDLVLPLLEPWFTEIHVSDASGNTLWCGPLTYALDTVEAATVMWWTSARTVRTDVDYHLGGISTQGFVAELFTSALTPHDPNLLPHLVVHPGGTIADKAVEAYAGYAWDEARSLVGSEVDVWCRAREIHCAPAGTCNGTLGVVGAADIVGDVAFGRDGRKAATASIFRGMEGVLVTAGGPTYMSDGATAVLVETVTKDERVGSELAAQRAAAVRFASMAPVVMETADGSTVDCSAGIDPADLAPAVCVTIETPHGDPVQARITEVRWTSDGGENAVGVTVEQRVAT